MSLSFENRHTDHGGLIISPRPIPRLKSPSSTEAITWTMRPY
jgi:hypothetical protein